MCPTRHAAIWLLAGDSRLSKTAKEFFEKAALARKNIALSPISLAEIAYLIEKNRLPLSAFDDLKAALASPSHVLVEALFNVQVVEVMRLVSRSEVPDLPDRIVAATGLFYQVPVISRDARIRASQVHTIW